MKSVTNIVYSSFFKRFFTLAVLLSLFIIISAISYVNAISENLSENLFRLHVIANSDSTEDQDLKYLVRDNIIEYINELSQNATTKNEMILLIEENIGEITKIAQDTVNIAGYNYDVNVKIGSFNFPTKYYGDISLPAGMYDSLRIEIGNAIGQNWWCVLFPPLCFVDVNSGIVPESSKEIMKDNLGAEEYRLISDDTVDVQFKFKIIEMFQNISTKLAKD